MKAGNDYVILRVDGTHNETMQLGGHTLFIDTAWEPHENKKRSAEIVALPDALTDNHLLYEDSSGTKYFNNSFGLIGSVGDVAYIDWSCIDEVNQIDGNLYRIPWGEVYAIKQRGLAFNHNKMHSDPEERVNQIKWAKKQPVDKLPEWAFPLSPIITPLHGWVFLEPYVDGGFEEVNGVLCRTKGNLVTSTQVEPLTTVGRIAYIGRNAGGKSPVLPVGSLAVCNLEWAAEVDIDGKIYHAAHQCDIMGEFLK